MPELVPDYTCDASNLPFEYASWNPDWYSVVCRDWYKEQASKSNQNTMGDLYVFATDRVFGLTPCAPVRRYDTARQEFEFVAAFCIDVKSSGPLNEYYELAAQANYMLYNIGQDESRSENILEKDSDFRQFMAQIIE